MTNTTLRPLHIKQLRAKLYLMQLLVGEWELALSFNIKRSTLRQFINGSRATPPPRVTTERLEQIVGRYIKYNLPSDPALRLAQMQVLEHVHSKLLRTNDRGTLTTSSKDSQTTLLVRDYIQSYANRGRTVTKQEVVEHFRSKEWVNRWGFPLAEATVRTNIYRVLGKWPELASTCVNATRGRKLGKKLTPYGSRRTK